MEKDRIPSYLEKQNKLYREKKHELEDLKEELKKYKSSKPKENRFNEIPDEKELDYNKRIKELSKEYYSVLLSRYLDLDISTQALAYLLSKVEQQEYIVKEFKTKLYRPTYPSYSNPQYCEPEEFTYNICYLVKETNEEEAKQELEKKYTKKEDYFKVNKYLKIPSENYIQIAYYKGNKQGKRIEYTYNNCVSITDIPDTFIVSSLCDERYEYIIDYIEKIIEHKLEQPKGQITLEEMKQIADEFVKNKQKSLKK